MTPSSITRLSILLRDNKVAERDVSFAADLVRSSQSRALSPKQLAWVETLIQRAERGAPAPTNVGGDVTEIFALFERASAAGLKWPKIHLEAEDGTPVQFSRAGERSKYVGQVQITDGAGYGSNRYFGRIDTAGNFTAGKDVTPSVRSLIVNFAADPAGVAALYGKRTGNCCFCHRDLSTDESLAVGYGPVCADKFGLPWGEVRVYDRRDLAETQARDGGAEVEAAMRDDEYEADADLHRVLELGGDRPEFGR